MYAGLGKRIAASVIDWILLFFVGGFAMSLIFGGSTSNGFSLTGMGFWVWCLMVLAYFTLLEGTRGQTLGKMLLKLKVTKEDGRSCDLKAAFIRTLLIVVDMLPFAYIVGLILISTSPKKQRLGDRVAHTVVMNA